jgi:septal ring factor EnvC (AmiA/AmiB activator)
MRIATLAMLIMVVMTACARRPEPTAAPIIVEAALQQLYLAERYHEVVRIAAGIIEAEPEQRERVAEARFFRALAWMAQDPRGNQARALLELRRLEFEFSDVIWGHLAALYVAAATRVDALQATLLELGFDQRELQARIEVLEQSLVELHAELGKRDTQVDELERERNDLTEQLDEARAEAATTIALLRELEDELAALKQIDMQREP